MNLQNHNQKDVGIESLRVYGMMMMVFFHATCFFSSPVLNGISKIGIPVRLALFTIISGFVYSLRPARSNLSQFLYKKSLRILVPALTLVTLVSVAKFYYGSTDMSDPLVLYRNLFVGDPRTQYWFLPILFLIFILIAIADSFMLLERFWNWFILLSCSFIFTRIQEFDYSLFWGFFYLWPFFLYGYGLNRHKDFIDKISSKTLLMILFPSFVVYLYALFGENVPLSTDRYSILQTLYGLSAITLLFRYRQSLPDLSRYGTYVFPIFLFHLQILSLGALILKYAHLPSLITVFALTLFGFILPILMCRQIRKSYVLSMILLGEKRKSATANLISPTDG